ncbi:MAG: hypothetical protein JWO77_174 [Ilumatobacteraceae bacterium]|nr:hypothetical protein [Ilumatobacteraceae bacterium]
MIAAKTLVCGFGLDNFTIVGSGNWRGAASDDDDASDKELAALNKAMADATGGKLEENKCPDSGKSDTIDADEDEPDETTTTVKAGPGATKTDPLSIGADEQVGDYAVKVTSVDQDAVAEVKGYNEFNEDPSNDRYVLVSLDATYTGDTEGDPSSDLTVTLSGGDSKQYDSYSCSADLGERGYPGTIESGGTASYLTCFDVPEVALKGGAVFVEDSMSFDETDRTYWALS